jgi:hypothetical protein
MEHPVFANIMTTRAISKFKSMNPTIIGRVSGYTFYECPVHGDETALYATDGNGNWGKTWFWEVPQFDEIA